MVPAGGGEQAILLRFFADRQTIDELAKAGHLTQDDVTINQIRAEGGDWQRLWEEVFSIFAKSGGDPWANVAPMKRPVLYQKQGNGPHEFMRILWDEDSQRAYLVWSNT